MAHIRAADPDAAVDAALDVHFDIVLFFLL